MSFDINNPNWALELLKQAKERNIHPLAANMLGVYRLSGKLPLSWDTTTPVNVWSPHHHVFGGDLSSPRSRWYFDGEHQTAPEVQDDRIYLVLHPTTTRSDMEYFLSRNWPQVSELLGDIGKAKKRRQPSALALRNIEIRARKAAGESYTDLVKAFGLSKRRIEQITKE